MFRSSTRAPRQVKASQCRSTLPLAQIQPHRQQQTATCQTQNSCPPFMSSILLGISSGLLTASMVISQPSCWVAANALGIQTSHTIAELALSEEALRSADLNLDGLISPAEFEATYKRAGLPVEPEQLAQEMAMSDLNADGSITVNELLTAVALDSAVGYDGLAEGTFELLDADHNGSLNSKEWKVGLGDLGAGGEDLKDLIFRKTDHMSRKNGSLDPEATFVALKRLRNIVLGYQTDVEQQWSQEEEYEETSLTSNSWY